MKANSMAAMREALERAIDAIQTMIALYDEEHTAAVQIGATWERSDTSEVNAIVKQARAALAAPARNCDLYQRCNAAWKAYNAIQDRYRLPGFDVWLFERVQAGAVAESAHCHRNCDVYTDPDEAQAAYERYCMAGDHYGWSVWIQLPYEPEEAAR